MISIFCGMFVLCKEWYAMLAAVLVAEPFTPGLKPGASLMGYNMWFSGFRKLFQQPDYFFV